MVEHIPTPPQRPGEPTAKEAEGGVRMTLGEHLEELRMRLFRSALAVAVAFGVCWGFQDPLGEWIRDPYVQARDRLNADLFELADEAIAEAEHSAAAGVSEQLGKEEWREWFEEPGYPELKILRSDLRVPDRMKGDAASHGFLFLMKMCLFVGLILSGPVVLWQVWQFVAAGLYKVERQTVYRYFPFSVILFGAGILFGYYVMVPNALYFLARITLTEIQYFETVGNYWTFLTGLTLALGLVFQLPVIMMAAAKMDLIEPDTFAKYRRHMLVGSLLVAALITPPDPFTQMGMAIPIVVLYEAGIWLGRFFTTGISGPGKS